MTRLFCILLTLLFSLSGSAMAANSDFCHFSNAAKSAPNYVQMEFPFARGVSVQALLAAQVNREMSEANIDSLVGNGDGDAINSVVSAIDLAVGTARSDGRNEWKQIELKLKLGSGSRIGAFDNGTITQKSWKHALLADYLLSIGVEKLR